MFTDDYHKMYLKISTTDFFNIKKLWSLKIEQIMIIILLINAALLSL